ncbi:MAG: metallophosphoesterase [candidate division Zixibacteria bacterium]|nr:metallophosphoesterase [candidate division Zixibacteria bacterium]
MKLPCLFVTDIHGNIEQYHKLFRLIEDTRPSAVFLGGDLLPSGIRQLTPARGDFVNQFLAPGLQRIRDNLGDAYPRIFMILGNDDGRYEEHAVFEAAARGIWDYCHSRVLTFHGYSVYGYAYVPPTPFQLKDWERYDVSRYVDPGCVSPEEGTRSIPVTPYEQKYTTIARDLTELTEDADLTRAVFLFHTPPYKTNLDRAALDEVVVDYAPADVYVGSVAVREFIAERQPLLTLHGHVHESPRITGSWQDRIGRTVCFSAAHDGKRLAVVHFDPARLDRATRELY